MTDKIVIQVQIGDWKDQWSIFSTDDVKDVIKEAQWAVKQLLKRKAAHDKAKA